MTEEEITISQEAVKDMRTKKAYLIEKYANLKRDPAQKIPGSVFMAGSPGAGKTEFSKSLISQLGKKAVRIDPDEIRQEISQYNGANAYLFQSAVTIGVDTVYSSVLKNDQNFLLDGTLAREDRALQNITRALKKRDAVDIFYLYQDPQIAWKFTQDREKIEGRHITKEAFINAFCGSKETANKMKQVFGQKVRLHLVTKDYKHSIEGYKINIDNIDNHLKKLYNKEELERLLP